MNETIQLVVALNKAGSCHLLRAWIMYGQKSSTSPMFLLKNETKTDTAYKPSALTSLLALKLLTTFLYTSAVMASSTCEDFSPWRQNCIIVKNADVNNYFFSASWILFKLSKFCRTNVMYFLTTTSLLQTSSMFMMVAVDQLTTDSVV